jgi:hypothetical protein
MRVAFSYLSLALWLTWASSSLLAADNQLTDAEKAEGWQLLFNGSDVSGWKCNNGKPPADTVLEDGTLVPYKSGGYVLIYDKQFADFILKCEVKMPEHCNSGVFFRIGDPKDPVQTGFEVQVLNNDGVSRNSWGSIYDLVAPSKNNLKPTGQWNSIVITCRGPHITVETNGEEVSKINCDEWTEPGTRLDGSKHKFRKAIKDFPRQGYLGFQDHGAKVWYKNVKILELKD